MAREWELSTLPQLLKAAARRSTAAPHLRCMWLEAVVRRVREWVLQSNVPQPAPWREEDGLHCPLSKPFLVRMQRVVDTEPGEQILAPGGWGEIEARTLRTLSDEEVSVSVGL